MPTPPPGVRNLFSPQEVREKIDYIHMCPVRRGLCAHPADWPWSSARAYEGAADAPIRIDFESMPDDVRQRALRL
ncbi:hypothetical protein RAS1_17820 [Phycisphaerae bacterium RAS1]|nr:hypothetical protein RAS1_17820 [Phycisphaerae bacterium RAS1]